MWNHVGHSEHWTPPLWLVTRRLQLGAPHASLSVCVLGRLPGGIRLYTIFWRMTYLHKSKKHLHASCRTGRAALEMANLAV